MQALQFAIGNGIRRNTRQKLTSSLQLRNGFAIAVGVIGRDSLVNHVVVSVAVASSLAVYGQVVEHLMLGLLLGVKHLLHSQDLVDEQPVGLRNLRKQLLELLNLLLCGSQLFRDNTDVLAGGEVLGRLGLAGSWCLAANVVEIVFAVDAEVRMLEFQNLLLLDDQFESGAQ